MSFEIKQISCAKGRGVFATAPFVFGDTILEDQPISSEPFDGRYAGPGPAPRSVLDGLAGQLIARQRRETVSKTPRTCDLMGESRLAAADPMDEATGQILKNSFRSSVPGHPDLARLSVYVQVAFFNHSCWPNAFQLRTGSAGVARVVALAPIAVGDEITICYHPTILCLPREQRRLFIQQMDYNFECQCQRCAGPKEAQVATVERLLLAVDEPNYDALRHARLQAALQREQDSSSSRTRGPVGTSDQFQRHMNALLQFAGEAGLGPCHWQMLEMRSALAPMLAACGCNEPTMLLCEQQFEAHRRVLPARSLTKAALFDQVYRPAARATGLTDAQALAKAAQFDPNLPWIVDIYDRA